MSLRVAFGFAMSTVAGEDERKSGDAAVPAKAPVNADGSTPLVLVTGVSGYIGAHIAQQLLRAGYRCVYGCGCGVLCRRSDCSRQLPPCVILWYRVRGTTRSLKNTTKVTALRGLCPEAKHPIELVRGCVVLWRPALRLTPSHQVELDLLDADSWTSAVKGCTYVQHIASPFIIGKIDEALMLRTAIEVCIISTVGMGSGGRPFTQCLFVCALCDIRLVGHQRGCRAH